MYVTVWALALAGFVIFAVGFLAGFVLMACCAMRGRDWDDEHNW